MAQERSLIPNRPLARPWLLLRWHNLSFSSLVRHELIPKAEAEKMLKRLIKANEAGGIANEVAAALLAIVLKEVSSFQPATRQ